jgi:hypothetical protein
MAPSPVLKRPEGPKKWAGHQELIGELFTDSRAESPSPPPWQVLRDANFSQ